VKLAEDLNSGRLEMVSAKEKVAMSSRLIMFGIKYASRLQGKETRYDEDT
jgi:hypothetical protein